MYSENFRLDEHVYVLFRNMDTCPYIPLFYLLTNYVADPFLAELEDDRTTVKGNQLTTYGYSV